MYSGLFLEMLAESRLAELEHVDQRRHCPDGARLNPRAAADPLHRRAPQLVQLDLTYASYIGSLSRILAATSMRSWLRRRALHRKTAATPVSMTGNQNG
jgi:hypothetical protein